MLNELRERTSDGQRRGTLYHVLYNMSNSFYYLRSNHDVNTQCNSYLLACSPPKLLTDLYQSFTRYEVALVVLLNHAYTRRSIPFLNARATKVRT